MPGSRRLLGCRPSVLSLSGCLVPTRPLLLCHGSQGCPDTGMVAGRLPHWPRVLTADGPPRGVTLPRPPESHLGVRVTSADPSLNKSCNSTPRHAQSPLGPQASPGAAGPGEGTESGLAGKKTARQSHLTPVPPAPPSPLGTRSPGGRDNGYLKITSSGQFLEFCFLLLRIMASSFQSVWCSGEGFSSRAHGPPPLTWSLSLLMVH